MTSSWFHAHFIFYESIDLPYLLTNENFATYCSWKKLIIKPKYLEMFVLETQVPQISWWMIIECCISWCTGAKRLQTISWCNFTFTWTDHVHFLCGIPRNEYHLLWHHSINQSQSKCVVTFCSHLVLLFAPLPSLYFTKCFIFFVWYFHKLLYIVQTLRICCDAEQCIFSVAHPSY